MTPLATQVQRQKTVVEWIEKAKPSVRHFLCRDYPKLKASLVGKGAGIPKNADVESHRENSKPRMPNLNGRDQPHYLPCVVQPSPDHAPPHIALSDNQPENYTAAVIVWNILKDPRSLIEELGPYLHLYEARKDLKSFRSVQPSKEIGKLYRKGRDADPMIYVVDDRKRYVVATLLERKDERDEGEAKKGIVLSTSMYHWTLISPTQWHRIGLNAASLQESINEAKVHVDLQGKLDFRVNGFLATRLLPLSTSLTEQNPDLIAFSSDYDIILYPPQQQGQDGTGGSSLASHKRSRFKSLIKRVFRI